MTLNSTSKQAYLKDETFLWFAASFLSLFFASKSLGLSLGYALDDYATLATPSGGMQGFLLSQGRFTFALIQTGMDIAGLKQPELAGLGFFLCAAGLLLVGWLTVAGWLKENRLMAVGIGALLGAHPFFAEYVSFRQALFPMGVCSALIAGAIYLLNQDIPTSISRLCAAASLAALASGGNQLTMALFCIAALGISLRKHASIPPTRALIYALRDAAVAGALASIIYLLIFAATKYALAFNSDARMSMLSFNQLGGRVHDVALMLKSIFNGTHPLIGTLAAIGTGFAIIALAVRASTKPDQWLRVLVGVLVIAVGLVLGMLPTAISGTWWPMPRTLIALPFAIALGIAILSTGASQVQVRLASAALFVAVVALAGKSGSLLLNQQRLNRWDIALAREITLKVAEGRQIDAATPIVIHRAKFWHQSGEGMVIGDANLSAMSVGWALDALFVEATGRRLKVMQAAEGDTTCAEAPAFPSAGSILEIDKTVNVCL
jgi:hypothetical protein